MSALSSGPFEHLQCGRYNCGTGFLNVTVVATVLHQAGLERVGGSGDTFPGVIHTGTFLHLLHLFPAWVKAEMGEPSR